MSGRLIAVVGPSGVGKDSIMAGITARDPRFRIVKRTITRAPDLGGEDYTAMSPQTFADAAARGAFALHWQAHGLSYGIPAAALDAVRSGQDCLANLSRSALSEAARIFPALVVLNITASADVLAARLAARGRETPEDIAARLSRMAKPLPLGLNIITVCNDGALAETVAAACAALQPVSA